MISFSNKAIKGIKWTTVSVLCNSFIRLIQVAILTRFLTKTDFGTIAIASLLIGFTDLFLDMGLSAAIIHKQKIPRNHYSSLFWFNIITGLIVMLVLFISAPLIAGYYNDSSLKPIIQLLSLNVLFSSIGRQHMTIRQKKLNFKFIAVVDVTNSVLTFSLAILLALNGFGVYTLVYSTLFNVLFPAMFYMIHGIKTDKNVTFHFSLSETLSYLKIGIYQIGARILDYIARELDIFIISSTLGRDILGAYSLCKKIIIMLYGIISPILMNVLTPLFAEIQSAINEVQNKFTRLIEIVSTINYPIFFVVALLSPGILRILYGESYTSYYFVLSLLSINYGILSVSGAMTASQVALGRTDVGFYWTIYRIVSTTFYIYVGSRFSLIGIPIAILIGTIINLIPFWYIQMREILHISLRTFIGNQLIPFITTLILYAGMYFLVSVQIKIGMMIALSIVFILTYCIVIKIFQPKNYILNFFSELYLNWRAKHIQIQLKRR